MGKRREETEALLSWECRDDGYGFHTHSLGKRARQAPPLQARSENMQRRSSQHLMGGAGLLDAQGHLVGDADAVALEGDDFFRVIGEDANVLEAEVDQDLGADAAFVLDHALARRLAIKLAAL